MSAFGLGLGLLAGAGVVGSVRAEAQAVSAPTAVRDGGPQIEFDLVDGRVTAHTGEVDVRRLLEVVSRRAGVSLVISPRVHGAIIADFEKVEVDDLIRAVLRMANLVEQVDGGIHFIYARDELDEGARPKAVAQRVRTAPPGPPAVGLATSTVPVVADARGSDRPAPVHPTLLARLFGIRSSDDDQRPRRAPSPRVDRPAASAAAPAPAPVLLDVGSQIEAMSAGRLLANPPFWTPAPVSKPKADPAVATAGFVVEPAPPPSSAAVARRHETRAGETFETVSQAYYGSPRFARALWWANRDAVAWPAALAAGKRIEVPPREALDPRMLAANPPATVSSALPTLERITADATSRPRSDRQVQPASLSPPSDGRRPVEGGVAVYVVRPGDTIRKVAVACFGDDSRAVEIADLNREALQAVGRPRVGQRLILPPGANPP